MQESRPRAAASIVAVAGCVLALAACGSAAKSTAAGGDRGYSQALRFSECMRSHGVTSFPDPNPTGGIKIGLGEINAQSPGFQQAQSGCRHLLPGGGPPRVVSESTKLALLRHAECMRAHGVSDYPNPIFPPGGGIETLVNVDPSSPVFRSAAKACNGP